MVEKAQGKKIDLLEVLRRQEATEELVKQQQESIASLQGELEQLQSDIHEHIHSAMEEVAQKILSTIEEKVAGATSKEEEKEEEVELRTGPPHEASHEIYSYLGMKYCPDCGTKLPTPEETYLCEHCEACVVPGQRYCPECGSELNWGDVHDYPEKKESRRETG